MNSHIPLNAGLLLSLAFVLTSGAGITRKYVIAQVALLVGLNAVVFVAERYLPKTKFIERLRKRFNK